MPHIRSRGRASGAFATYSWPRPVATLPALMTAALVGACADAPLEPGAASSRSLGAMDLVEISHPADGSWLQGTHAFRARLTDRALSDYAMTWSVDGGKDNRMYDAGGYKQADVTVDSWTWRGSGPYTVTFVATQGKGKKVTEVARRSVQIYVGSGPAAAVASVEVTPGSASVALGATAQLEAVVRDAEGNLLADRIVSWTSSDPAVALVDGSGLVAGAGEGTAGITATSEGVSGTAVVTVTAPEPTVMTNPFASQLLYVDPYSNARKTADAWASTRPADALEMEKIASQSQADWFGDWSGDIRAAVDARVGTIAAAGALPVLVAYNIPGRDCNGYSAGGSASADAYRTWIRDFAAGIGSRKAVVILEPDALAAMDCLPLADQEDRVQLLLEAVQTFAAQGGVAVYIDAGHPMWKSASEMAARLERAGIAWAAGFSLNVSNFIGNTDNKLYGEAISAALGGEVRFVIDSSRNGLGPTADYEWCNPDGRALGTRPTATTGHPLVDAFVWIKRPGESDGTCNGGPSAGAWWADYALGLAERQTDVMAGTSSVVAVN